MATAKKFTQEELDKATEQLYQYFDLPEGIQVKEGPCFEPPSSLSRLNPFCSLLVHFEGLRRHRQHRRQALFNKDFRCFSWQAHFWREHHGMSSDLDTCLVSHLFFAPRKSGQSMIL